MIESDLAVYLGENIETTFTVGRRLPSSEEDINVFLVGSIIENNYLTRLDSLQISVRSSDIERVNELVEEVLSNLRGYYGTLGTGLVMVFIDALGGMIFEEEGSIAHVPILISIRRSL